MTPPPDAFACTLDAEGARSRLPQARDLAERLLGRERIGQRLVMRFADDERTGSLVDEFVRDEQQCCTFFGFAVRRGAGEVVLELTAPADAAHMLDAAMAAFDPTLGDDERLDLHRAHATGSTSSGADR